ncbi:hypothetical protein ACFT8W_21130 [Streptomyces hygroscopicus]|uniref:hypothetical protein n=1 Tax=Streptomyces hygroscopicus TaxID=1912 RepID=UPI003637D072
MDDNWVERGQEISSTTDLREYIAEVRAAVSHMHTGMQRAAFGALTGRSWLDTPGDERPEDILGEHLEMTVTPAGMAAKDAALRQSLAVLVASLDAADRATLTAWLAEIAAADPHRTA